jgi:hypothetical protein
VRSPSSEELESVYTNMEKKTAFDIKYLLNMSPFKLYQPIKSLTKLKDFAF